MVMPLPTKKSYLELLTSCLSEMPGVVAGIAFGSVVTESFTERSDLDIGIIADGNFSPSQILEIRNKLYQITGRDIHLVLIDSDLSLVLRNQIAKKGVVLFGHGSKRLEDFLIKTPQMFMDFERSRKPLETAYIERKLA